MPKPLRWFAFLWAVAVVGGFLFIPRVYQYESVTTSASGIESRTRGSRTLGAGSDWDGLVALSIPVLAALSAVLPWPARFRRTADVLGALVLTLFCILGALSVGMFFVPAALALAAVAAWPRHSTDG